MTMSSYLDPLVSRVEHLLAEYEALQHANQQLTAQVQSLSQERDSLRSRLKAARARVDELIERLPINQEGQ